MQGAGGTDLGVLKADTRPYASDPLTIPAAAALNCPMRLFVSKSLGFGFRVGVSVPLRLRRPRAAVWRDGRWEPLPERAPPVEHLAVALGVILLLVAFGLAH